MPFESTSYGGGQIDGGTHAGANGDAGRVDMLAPFAERGGNQMTIEEAIKTREAAEDCIDLLRDTASGMSPEQQNRFWEAIHAKSAEIGGIITEEPGEELVMHDTEAAIFERQVMEFGKKYKGERIYNIPRSYLEWFDEERRTDTFWSDLTRYLRSGHGEEHGE